MRSVCWRVTSPSPCWCHVSWTWMDIAWAAVESGGEYKHARVKVKKFGNGIFFAVDQMKAGAGLNANSFDGLDLNKWWVLRLTTVDAQNTQSPQTAYYLPCCTLRRCISSMNLLVTKSVILVDHAPMAGQELGRGRVLQRKLFAKRRERSVWETKVNDTTPCSQT